MKLTATPFDPQTGTLLPVYRDAYLRGDLARESARAVENYLRKDADQAHTTVTRWQEMTTQEVETAAPTTWVQKQLLFVRQQPQRFRRRATTMVALAALVAGVSMAGTGLRTHHGAAPTVSLNAADLSALTAASAEAGASRLVTVRGRILNEKGEPLVGATVLRKGAQTGVSTDANGNYVLQLPAAATLQYGYAGYHDQEMSAAAATAGSVTLQPRPAKHHRWLFF